MGMHLDTKVSCTIHLFTTGKCERSHLVGSGIVQMGTALGAKGEVWVKRAPRCLR